MNRSYTRWMLAAGLLWLVGQGGTRAAVLGDVNGDGKVTVEDAILVLKFATQIQLPTDSQRILGDVYPFPGTVGRVVGDHQLDVNDALQILRFAAQIISKDAFGGNATFLALTPPHVILGPLDQVQFTAVPVNYAAPVSWTLTGDVGDPGQISTDGLYIAPRVIVGGTSVTVNAASGNQTASAGVDLTDTGPPPPPP